MLYSNKLMKNRLNFQNPEDESITRLSDRILHLPELDINKFISNKKFQKLIITADKALPYVEMSLIDFIPELTPSIMTFSNFAKLKLLRLLR